MYYMFDLTVGVAFFKAKFFSNSIQYFYPKIIIIENTFLIRKLGYFKLFLRKYRENSSVILCFIDPLRRYSHKVFSLGILFKYFRICMDTFSSPETRIIALSQKSYFTILLNFPNLKSHWGVFIIRIIEHSIEFLHIPQIDLLILIKFKSIKPALILLCFHRNK
jgi:hypothetical protein